MKSLITYYSFSGNTDKAAQILADALKSKGEVDMQRLKPKTEIMKFFAQCRAAFTNKRAELEGSVNFDASHHDLILIGSPVWAFAPTPVINSFLDKLSGMNGKRAIVFLTYGSGAGVKKCFNHIKTILKNKGAFDVLEIGISDSRTGDANYVASLLEKTLA
ncbi:MAG: flavodoxin [Candidatus Omnitrophica bacterium]|nr:flavodoxin [Candidatus Omnitrophota bacterium]